MKRENQKITFLELAKVFLSFNSKLLKFYKTGRISTVFIKLHKVFQVGPLGRNNVLNCILTTKEKKM